MWHDPKEVQTVLYECIKTCYFRECDKIVKEVEVWIAEEWINRNLTIAQAQILTDNCILHSGSTIDQALDLQHSLCTRTMSTVTAYTTAIP